MKRWFTQNFWEYTLCHVFSYSQNSAPNFKESSDTSPDLFLMSKAASIATPMGASLVESPLTDEAKPKKLPNPDSVSGYKF